MNQKLYVVLGKDRLGAWTVMHPPTPSRSLAEIVYNAWVETKGNGLKDEVLILCGRPRRWEKPPNSDV